MNMVQVKEKALLGVPFLWLFKCTNAFKTIGY